MLPESSLQIIVAEEHAKALQWEEEGKEFLLYGELYDVAKIKMVNGKTLLYCLNDKNEEKLLHEFAKAIKSATNNSDNNKNTKSNYKFQLSDYYFFKATEKAAVIITSAVCQHLFFISSLTSSVKEVNAPPPRV